MGAPADPVWHLCSADQIEVSAGARETLVVAGKRARLGSDDVVARLPVELRRAWPAILGRIADDVGETRAATSALSVGDDHATRVVVGVVSPGASRHEAPARPEQVADLVAATVTGPGRYTVLLACEGADDALAYAIAVTRALPRFSRKTGQAGERDVQVAFALGQGQADANALGIVRDAVADAMAWYDMPAAELSCDAFVDLAVARGRAVGAEVAVLRAADLASAGLGGFAGVGAAATQEPALVALRHRANDDRGRPRPAWVGKGVVYDTGGLSLKRPREMRTMKGDMAGAGAVLAAFCAAATLGGPAVNAVLCIAENAIGPGALRPDDIVTLGSGKTVEITDTDSEGRLLLADGLAWAARQWQPDVVVDLATLTDSAVVATGHHHAAMVSNDEALERAAVVAGRATGDLVHPLPFAPATLRATLGSEVADLRNAPANDAAGASWAAQFIAEHLGDYRGGWLHVDMEGPARAANGRGTGFGVGLLLKTFGYV